MWGLPLYRAVKTAMSVLFGASFATVVLSQFDSIDFGAVGNITGIAAIAMLVGRYTFRQLEDYRKDLGLARKRGDLLEQRMDVMEARERILFSHIAQIEYELMSENVSVPSMPDLPSVPPLHRNGSNNGER